MFNSTFAFALGSGGDPRWSFDSSGNFIPGTDDVYDIGTQTVRPRIVFVGAELDTPAIRLSDGTGARIATIQVSSPHSILLTENSGTTFNLLQFGGTTSAYSALRACPSVSITTTATIASPGVFITPSAHGLVVGDMIYFTSTGNLPSGSGATALSTGIPLYVQSVPSSTTFTITDSVGGAVYNTSGSQSGVHTVNRWGGIFGRTADNSAHAYIGGRFLAALGQADNVSIGSRPNTGIYFGGGFADTINFSCAGVTPGAFYNQGISLVAAATLQWTSDTYLWRDAAGTLAMRNGANEQAFNIYGSYTDASNYRRLALKWDGAQNPILQNENVGTGGSDRLALNGTTYLEFKTGGGQRGYFDSSALNLDVALKFVPDNTFDIGGVSANRPRNLNVADTITAGNTIQTSGFVLGTYLQSARTAGIGLYLGPSGTSAYAALKGAGPAVVIRRADDAVGTFAGLPAASSSNEGAMAPISDSTTNVWGATITGGGANHVMAYSNGTNWTVMAK